MRPGIGSSDLEAGDETPVETRLEPVIVRSSVQGVIRYAKSLGVKELRTGNQLRRRVTRGVEQVIGLGADIRDGKGSIFIQLMLHRQVVLLNGWVAAVDRVRDYRSIGRGSLIDRECR